VNEVNLVPLVAARRAPAPMGSLQVPQRAARRCAERGHGFRRVCVSWGFMVRV